MATQRILADEDFGRIVIRTRRTARNISMRVRPEGLYVVVPPFSRADKILEAIAPFRPRLLESFRKVAVRLIDFNFSIQADCFRLSLVPSRLRCFTVKEEGEEMRIYCPADTDFGRDEVQKLVRNAIVRALKRRAESFLPPLLAAWSARCGLPVQRCPQDAASSLLQRPNVTPFRPVLPFPGGVLSMPLLSGARRPGAGGPGATASISLSCVSLLYCRKKAWHPHTPFRYRGQRQIMRGRKRMKKE